MNRQALTEVVAAALGCKPDSLTLASRLGVHQGWDSFGHLEVMMELERLFGVEINDENIRRFSTFGEILTLASE